MCKNHLSLSAVALVVLAIIATRASGQTSASAPSRRIMPLCRSFMTTTEDLARMMSGIGDREEARSVLDMAGVAEISHERCISVHSMLFTYELISAGPDRKKAGEYVAFRMSQYAERKADIDYFNKLVGQTKLPGVAREAQSMRDRLRAFADSLRSLQPK